MCKKIFILVVFYSLFTSCSKNSPDDLLDIVALPPNTTISYDNNVKQIINANCIGCHGAVPSNGAPMRLNDFSSVKNAVINLGLINRINLPQTNGAAMPTGGPKLQQQQIDLIVQWQNQGFTN